MAHDHHRPWRPRALLAGIVAGNDDIDGGLAAAAVGQFIARAAAAASREGSNPARLARSRRWWDPSVRCLPGWWSSGAISSRALVNDLGGWPGASSMAGRLRDGAAAARATAGVSRGAW